jgi:DNA-directed RNA polymerase subunit K/omega
MYDRAIEKIGGPFKLTVLLQKRIREIVRGASPLVPISKDMTPIDIALKEVMDDKVGFAGDGAVLIKKPARESVEVKEKPKAAKEKKKKK